MESMSLLSAGINWLWEIIAYSSTEYSNECIL
jgi:hypothetical protein